MANKNGRLSKSDFLLASGLTQIVCVDLIVENEKGEFLLGLRKNPPAKGSLFVPGGKVYKCESLKNGADRVMTEELGCSFDYKLVGVYEHVYMKDNCAGDKTVDSHYVVFAVHIKLPHSKVNYDIVRKQHASHKWMKPSDIVSDDTVHDYSKSYFAKNPINMFVGSN